LKSHCLLYKPDIVCIVETWLGSDVLDSEICIPDYELTRLDRDRHGGGVIYLFFCVYNNFAYKHGYRIAFSLLT